MEIIDKRVDNIIPVGLLGVGDVFETEKGVYMAIDQTNDDSIRILDLKDKRFGWINIDTEVKKLKATLTIG